jgi:hypothetical protein
MFRQSIVSALAAVLILQLSGAIYAAAAPGFFERGVELYKSGRYSDATDSFDQAIRKRERVQDSQAYIERIRKETVERIRNKALTGISKANWQSKFYFMNIIDGRVKIGISSEEMFERDSTNFRPGAVEALAQIATALAKSENNRIDIELINEINQEAAVSPEITSQQLTAIFSYLSLAARKVLPPVSQ